MVGRDCIGCAKTGSGKTAAFALPILQTLSEDPYGIFALVLTPTRYMNTLSLNFLMQFSSGYLHDFMLCRELAFQISEQFDILGKPLNIKVSTITGGRGETLICIENYSCYYMFSFR